MQHVSKFKWNDGYGALATGATTATGVYKVGEHLVTRKQRRLQRQLQQEDRAIQTKKDYKANIISKNQASQRLNKLGFQSNFLETGDLQPILPVKKKFPFASISISDSNTNPGEFVYQKSTEYFQVAEVSAGSYSENNSLELTSGQSRNLIGLSAVGFFAGFSLYLVVVKKLRNWDWYKRNFNQNQFMMEEYEKRLNVFENQQTKILETNTKILELLQKNQAEI